MNLLSPILSVLAIIPALAGTTPYSGLPTAPFTEYSLEELELQLAAFDNELEQLARFKVLGGLGPIGFESETHREAHHTEWVQIDWEEPSVINEVVLVPMIWHDSKIGFTASGFPAEFQVIAGMNSNSNGTVIASFNRNKQRLPRIAPFVVPCAITASWVRVQATVLSERGVDDLFALQMAELLAFSDEENMALMCQTTSSSVGRQEGFRRNKAYLVDGLIPYEMDAGSEESGAALVSTKRPENQASITIDLGKSYPINRIHLHAFNSGQTAPQAYPTVFGLPDRFIIEGANQEDFSDAVTLLQHRKTSIYDASPILMRRFPESPHRFVRLTAQELNALANLPEMMSFAEIEIFSDGRNVALHRPLRILQSDHVSKEAMTDGHNAYGRILPLRQWVNELARRHELNVLRPGLRTEINRRHAKQKQVLRTMTWLSALLAAGIVIAILIERLLHTNQLKKLRERLAADLHDELGANLHAIHMLSDLAKEASSEEELLDLFERSRVFAGRSRNAVRNFTHMLDAGSQYSNLKEAMTQSAERLLRDMDYAFSFEGEDFTAVLKAQQRMDLFLFFKEGLTNIIRHSSANQASIKINCSSSELNLMITDNGVGLQGRIPVSLKRRARLLKGRLSTTDRPEGGTQIMLTVKLPKRIPRL